MPVSCIEDECIYILKDKSLAALERGWVKAAGNGGGGSSSNLPFVVLEESEYNALQEIDQDTLYFIYEPWEFGSSFPIYF